MFENHKNVEFEIAIKSYYVYILFEKTKDHKECRKNGQFGKILKPEAGGQVLLSDRSVLIGQKLVENAQTEKFKCNIFRLFSTNVIPACSRHFFGKHTLKITGICIMKCQPSARWKM